MNVDEAGRQRRAVARDRRVGIALGAVADDRDFTAGDGDVGDERRGPAAIVDAGITENCMQQRLA